MGVEIAAMTLEQGKCSVWVVGDWGWGIVRPESPWYDSIELPHGFAGIPHIAWPAQNPDAQAHWKLKPPSWPVTSTTSPIKKRPGTFRASMVLAESSPVSTPPAVTSAFP